MYFIIVVGATLIAGEGLGDVWEGVGVTKTGEEIFVVIVVGFTMAGRQMSMFSIAGEKVQKTLILALCIMVKSLVFVAPCADDNISTNTTNNCAGNSLSILFIQHLYFELYHSQMLKV